MRINFSPSTVKKIAQEAMFICSNPDCLRFTGYSTSAGDIRTLADAGHIDPASGKGPRGESGRQEQHVRTAANGVWLCKICHKKVDDDPAYYSNKMLASWKASLAKILRRIVGKDLEAAILALQNEKRYYQEAKDFVSFLENKRVLYELMDNENAGHALDSIMLIRERLIQTRAKVNPDTALFESLNKIQAAIDFFFRNLGPKVDLRALRCDWNDPNWLKFVDELKTLRTSIIIIAKILSGNADYRVTWL